MIILCVSVMGVLVLVYIITYLIKHFEFSFDLPGSSHGVTFRIPKRKKRYGRNNSTFSFLDPISVHHTQQNISLYQYGRHKVIKIAAKYHISELTHKLCDIISVNEGN